MPSPPSMHQRRLASAGRVDDLLIVIAILLAAMPLVLSTRTWVAGGREGGMRERFKLRSSKVQSSPTARRTSKRNAA